jgi:hypothetical protein
MPRKNKTPQKRTRTNNSNGYGQTLENALKASKARRHLKRLREETNKVRKELGQPSIEEQEAQQKKESIAEKFIRQRILKQIAKAREGRIKVTFGRAAELDIKKRKEERQKKTDAKKKGKQGD